VVLRFEAEVGPPAEEKMERRQVRPPIRPCTFYARSRFPTWVSNPALDVRIGLVGDVCFVSSQCIVRIPH
jgi:hypothetical protein